MLINANMLYQVKQLFDDGLKHFEITDHIMTSVNPLLWPRLSLSPDQGGDGVAAYWFLTRHLKHNIDITYDPSHGVNNDVWLFLDAIHLKSLMLLFLVVFNTPHGPWSEDTRYRQCLSALTESFALHTPEEFPLFMSKLPQILQDGAFKHLQGHENPAEAVWQQLARENPWSRKGSKLVKSRFMAFCRTARYEAQHYTVRALGYEYVCLEMGWMTASKVKPLTIKPVADTSSSSKSTSAKVETSEEQQLRKSAQNNMVLSAIVFGSYDNACRLRLMLQLTAPLEEWHTTQNKALRSTADTLAWHKQQLEDGFFSTLYAIMKSLSQERSLSEVPFQLPSAAALALDSSLDDPAVFADDELAELMGDGALYLCGLRCLRNAWLLCGWPSRMVLCLSSEQVSSQEVQCFKKDHDNFQSFKSNPQGFQAIDGIAERSVFHLMCNKQYVQIFMRNDWQLNDEIKQFILNASSRVMASQVCEDAFNRQKNARKQPNRRGTVQRSMGIIMEQHVADEVHHYTPIEPGNSATLRSAMHVPETAYQSRMKAVPKEYLQIQGHRQKCEWFTTTSHMSCRPHIDLILISFVEKHRLHQQCSNLWLGALMEARHHMVVRHKHGGKWSRWYFPIKCVDNSCCLFWPADMVQLTEDICCWTPATSDVSLTQMCIPVLDLDKWEAVSITWRSPLWQGRTVGLSGIKALNGFSIRAFARSTPKSLLEVAAASAFFQLPGTWLHRLATHIGLSLEGSNELIDVLKQLMTHILGWPAHQIISHLEERLVALGTTAAHQRVGNELVDMQEAQELLDSDDKQEYKKKLQDEDNKKHTFKKYASQLAEMRRAAHAQMSAASSDGPGGARKKKKTTHKAPKRHVPEGDLTQPMAKLLCPPGTFIWRSVHSQAWCARYPPMKSFSRAWLLHGHREAAIMCAQQLWDIHILLGHADQCPIVWPSVHAHGRFSILCE